MSETLTTGLGEKPRSFLNRHLSRGGRGRSQPMIGGASRAKAAYEQAAAKAKPTLDAAEKLLAPIPAIAQVEELRAPYLAASAAVALSVQSQDYVSALTELATQVAAAKAILLAKGQADAAAARGRQVQAQIDQYNTLEPVLDSVRRSSIPDGGAREIERQNLMPGREFRTYLAALQALEEAKRQLPPENARGAERAPVPPELAQELVSLSEAVVAAATAYLDHYQKLTAQQQRSKESLAKKRYCEASLVTARQFGMAMQLDVLGKPTPENPWDAQTQTRAGSLMAAFSYEQGYQKATGLKETGGAGSSDSYWIKSKSIEDGPNGKPVLTTKGRGDFLFKPLDKEEFPNDCTNQKGAGAAKESLACANAKAFAQQTGIELDVPETHVVSVSPLAVAGQDMLQPPLVGSAQQHAGSSTQIAQIPRETLRGIKASEVRKIALLDIMSLSFDRHEGNIMADTTDPENTRLIPIDHGATLPLREDFPKLASRMGGLEYSATKGTVKPVNMLLQIPSAFEPFDAETLARLDMLDPEAMHRAMQDQCRALDEVHPGLDATGKVSETSLQMSKKAMMFLKQAAARLSPAEIQIALSQHGERLFDAAPEDFDDVAEQVITEAIPNGPALKEIMGFSTSQRHEMSHWLEENGWELGAGTRSDPTALVMARPKEALALFKSRTPNPNPPVNLFAPAPFVRLVRTQELLDQIIAAFPRLTGSLVLGRNNVVTPQVSAWTRLLQLGGIAEVQRVAAEIGGQAPVDCIEAVTMLQAWTALQTPDYAEERQALVVDPNLPCSKILTTLMRRKANQLQVQAQLASATEAGSRVDPMDMATGAAEGLLAEAHLILDGFLDATLAQAFRPDLDERMQRRQQGPDADETALDFAQRVEADLRGLVERINDAGLREMRETAAHMRQLLSFVRPPDGDAEAESRYSVMVDSAKELVEMAGALGMLPQARERMADLQQKWEAFRQIAVPAPENPPQELPQELPQAREQPVPRQVALGGFDWTAETASTVKRRAVRAGMISDKDTGMTSALKQVNAARAALASLGDDADPDARHATLTAADEALTAFAVFIAKRLRASGGDPSWIAYCGEVTDMTLAERQAVRDQLAALD